MTKRSDQDYHLKRERDEMAAAAVADHTDVQALHLSLATLHADRASGRIIVGEIWAGVPD